MFSYPNPRGVLPNTKAEGLDLTSRFEAKFGATSGQGHQIRGRLGKFCHHKTQKLGKSPNFGVISEIQRANFGVFVTYIFGGKIWGSNKNFRGKFWGQAPDLLIWKEPPGIQIYFIFVWDWVGYSRQSWIKFNFPDTCLGHWDASLSDKVLPYVQKLSPTWSTTGLWHSRRYVWDCILYVFKGWVGDQSGITLLIWKPGFRM